MGVKHEDLGVLSTKTCQQGVTECLGVGGSAEKGGVGRPRASGQRLPAAKSPIPRWARLGLTDVSVSDPPTPSQLDGQVEWAQGKMFGWLVVWLTAFSPTVA